MWIEEGVGTWDRAVLLSGIGILIIVPMDFFFCFPPLF